MHIIIGATGFIGTYTAEYFISQGESIIATGRNEQLGSELEKFGAKFISIDITKEDDFAKLPTSQIDSIIVLAGLLPANAHADLQIEDNAKDYFNTNVIGLINILEWARKNKIRKVISSCSYSDVSGAWGKGYKITEDEPRNFKFTGDHAVYVISKNAANDVMEYYNQQHGMQCSCFRFPPVYGVGPHGTILVNGKPYKSGIQTFIEKAKNGEPIEIWGDPNITRDIIYVKDVARAYYLASRSSKTRGLYNMTSGVPISLKDQVETVIKVFGNKAGSRIVYRPEKPNNTPSYLYSMEKAKRDFGFDPEYKDFAKMMEDYKFELEEGRRELLSNSRKR